TLDARERLGALAGREPLAVMFVLQHELGRLEARIALRAPGVQLRQAVHAVLLRQRRATAPGMFAAVAAAGQHERVARAEACHLASVAAGLRVQALDAGRVAGARRGEA